VLAKNRAGIGAPSNSTGRFPAKDLVTPPGMPGTPTVENVGSTSAFVKWSPPKNNGGSAIIGYFLEITLNKSGKERTWTTVKTPEKLMKEAGFEVKELVPGTEYEFRVTAVNVVGPGQTSPSSACFKYGELVWLWAIEYIIYRIWLISLICHKLGIERSLFVLLQNWVFVLSAFAVFMRR